MKLALTGCFWSLAMGSCSNGFVQLQEDIEHLRCKLSRLKRADNGFVLKQLCSAP